MKKLKLDSIEIGIIAICIVLVSGWLFMSSSQKNVVETQGNTTPSTVVSTTPITNGIQTVEPVQVQETVTSVIQDELTEAVPAKNWIAPTTKAFHFGNVEATVYADAACAGLRHLLLKDFKETVEGDERVCLYKSCSFAGLMASRNASIQDIRTLDDGAVIVTHAPMANGIVFEEIWTPIVGKDYCFSYKVRITNKGKETAYPGTLKISLGSMPAPTTSGGMFSMFSSSGADIADIDAYAINKDKVRTIDAAKVKKGKGHSDAQERYQWVSLHSKYFIGYLESTGIPFEGFSGYTNVVDNKDFISAYALFSTGSALAAGESREFDFKAYVGPKDYDRLSDLSEDAVSVLRMDLFFFFHPDWMGWLSRKILVALVWIRGFIPFAWGYGAAIVLITILIKMAFWPLTHKSTISMHRMQQIQPKIKELQEKYKDNKEVLNQKLMELYREYQVNPLGGCLPILLQMPVFFALFNTLRAAIELRHAGFLWVKDLSMPDVVCMLPLGFTELPICPLAIMMGITMIWQQMMMPATGDKNQVKMMRFMTIFFVFLLYGMPSGLTLYWTINQVLSIVQSYITNKKIKQSNLA